ncbi:MAG: undecaprenyl-diphosphatase UppP [Candidatus Aquicultorales bacterium]
MIEVLQAAVLGVVQGLGEFLPISSSAHLILVPWLFNMQDRGLTFDVALHFGTAIAVVAFFWNDFARLLGAFWTSVRRRAVKTQEERLSWYLVIGSVPGAVAGMLLEKYVETFFRTQVFLIAGMLAVMGVILFLADKHGKKSKEIHEVGFKDALVVGTMQALAVIPGVSRSGITMTTGLFRSFSRKDAARFSFLLSAPITLGAALYEGRKIVEVKPDLAFFVGILTSAIVGYFSIKYLLKYLQERSFAVFATYRLVAAGIVVAFALIRP